MPKKKLTPKSKRRQPAKAGGCRRPSSCSAFLAASEAGRAAHIKLAGESLWSRLTREQYDQIAAGTLAQYLNIPFNFVKGCIEADRMTQNASAELPPPSGSASIQGAVGG